MDLKQMASHALLGATGPGAFDFTQGDTNGTTFWRLVRDFLSVPTARQAACHAPKPILLNTGAHACCPSPRLQSLDFICCCSARILSTKPGPLHWK